MARAELVATFPAILGDIQSGLFAKAKKNRDDNTKVICSKADLFDFFGAKEDSKVISGGFALAHWGGDAAAEAEMKEKLKVTIRCIPQAGFDGTPWADAVKEPGACIFTGQPAAQRVVFAKSY